MLVYILLSLTYLIPQLIDSQMFLWNLKQFIM